MGRFFLICLLPLAVSCTVSKNYNPNRKYSPQELQQDFSLMRDILEEKHPSLYWYTSKDSMNYYFDSAYKSIGDSMTELQFGWQVLAPVLSNVRCGHTSFAMSKNWNRFIKDKAIPSFPLYMKVWKDTMLVLANLNKDTLVHRGDFVTAINGIPNRELIATLFGYMSADGFAENLNYIRLSSSFPYFHRNIYGLYKNYFVNYSDSTGKTGIALMPYFLPPEDSMQQKKEKVRKIPRKERLGRVRSLEFDSGMAILTINKFPKTGLDMFLRKTFRTLRKRKVENLVIDIRANGGGYLDKSVLLTKYIRKTPFKVFDTAAAQAKSLNPYGHYISRSLFANLQMFFMTHKGKDGRYHFGFWENHVFKPKRKNGFRGNVYVLTNGLTFSASTIFTNAVKGQDNVTIIGEETGGGWYGSSGILIPDITLPRTKLRVRLPFFRVVQYDHISSKGTGIKPDIYVGPNWRDILKRKDTKLEKVQELIETNQ